MKQKIERLNNAREIFSNLRALVLCKTNTREVLILKRGTRRARTRNFTRA